MSWYFSIVGHASDVKAAVNKEQYLPQPLKDTVTLFADTFEKQPASIGMLVESSGHYDSTTGGSVNSFILKQVVIAAQQPAQNPTTPPPGGWPQETESPGTGHTSVSPT